MKTTTSLALTLLAFSLLIFSSGCDEDACDQEGIISIDASDNSSPVISWEILNFLQVNDSTVIVRVTETTESITELTMLPEERVLVRLKAHDDQSGIQWMDWDEISAFGCTNGSETIFLDNFLVGIRESFPTGSENCAFQEVYHSREPSISAVDLCPSDQPDLSSGTFYFQGTAANGNNLSSEATLTLTVSTSEG